MSEDGRRSVLKNSAFVVASHVLTAAVAFGYAIVVARHLGRDQYGILAFSFSWYLTFIALTYLGMDVVLSREIGRDREVAQRLAGSTLSLRIGVAGVVGAASSGLGFLQEDDPRTSRLLLLFGVALVARAVWLWCTAMFVAFEETRHGLLVDLCCRPLEPLLAIVAINLLPWDPLAIVGAVHVISWSIQAGVGIALVRRWLTPLDFVRRTRDWPGILRRGLPGALYPLTLIWFVQGPIVLYRQAATTADELSQFALAHQIVGYLLIVPSLIATVALPALSRAAVRGDDRLRQSATTAIVGVPLVGCVVGLAALAFARPAVTFLFGDQFRGAGVILAQAVWLLIPFGLAATLQQVVFAKLNRVIASAPGLVGAVVMIGLYMPFEGMWGYRGALMATGLGLVVWVVGLLLLVRGGMMSRAAGTGLLGPPELIA